MRYIIQLEAANRKRRVAENIVEDTEFTVQRSK